MDRTGYLSAPKFRHKAPVAYPALRLAAFSQHLHTVVSFILWNKIGSLDCRECPGGSGRDMLVLLQ